MPDALLEIKNLSVSFAVGGVLLPAVREFNLTLSPNEVVGTCRGIRLWEVDRPPRRHELPAGERRGRIRSILYRGVDLLRANRATLDTIRGRRIAMIYQDPTTALNPAMAVGAQISEVLRSHLGMDGEGAASVRTSCCILSSSTTPGASTLPIPTSSAGACDKG